MKKIIFVHIVLLIAKTLNAQSYHPMLGETNQWIVNFNGESYSSDTKISCNVTYYTNKGDSTVSSKHYKRVYAVSSCGSQCRCATGFIGLIREDTSTRKIFYLDNTHNPEMIIYDFSLKNGDSMFIKIDKFPTGFTNGHQAPSPMSDFYLANLSTTSTYYGLGKKLTLINKKYDYTGTMEWVEGMGSLKSPLYFLNPPFSADGGFPQFLISLSCAMKDNTIILGDKSCEFVSINNTQDPDIRNIRAHLTSSSLLLWTDFQIKSNCYIKIFDLLGRCKYSNSIQPLIGNEGFYELPIPSGLPKGVYVITISNEGTQTSLKTVNY